MELAADWDGPPASGRPVLGLLHGFAGSRASWEPVRDGLRRFGATLAVELMGHGRSPCPDEPAAYTMPACLEQVEAVCRGLGLPAAVWVGYSMGGRVALQLAVHQPRLVAGLVLESATPGLADAAERAARVAADGELAERLLAEGTEAFMETWLAQPLFAGLGRLPEPERAFQRAVRVKQHPGGLASSLRGMGTGAMEPVWERLGEVSVPALLLAGEQDAKFTEIARRMAAALPRATLRIIPGAGHTIHAEAPGPYLAAVAEFFAGLSASP